MQAPAAQDQTQLRALWESLFPSPGRPPQPRGLFGNVQSASDRVAALRPAPRTGRGWPGRSPRRHRSMEGAHLQGQDVPCVDVDVNGVQGSWQEDPLPFAVDGGVLNDNKKRKELLGAGRSVPEGVPAQRCCPRMATREGRRGKSLEHSPGGPVPAVGCGDPPCGHLRPPWCDRGAPTPARLYHVPAGK